MGIILNSAQQKALRNLKIEELNDMQQAAIEHCRESQNMVLLSPTGTGKTLAFLLPLLERLNADSRGVQALIVLPTRELAKQVFDVWRSMATSFSVAALYGGRPLEQEIASLGGSSPSLVVGTPGRLLDHLNHASFAVEKCSQLVIDEFDKCLEMGFHEEMQELLGHLPNLTSRFLLSATDADEIPEFAGADNVKKLDFSECDAEPAARTAFYKITTTPEQRLQRLYELLCSFSGEPAIVFCNFRESVEEVRRFLAKERLIVSAYHGALEQKERELALYRFSSGCSNILISTDLAARGLDIKDVKHVIHFQRPMTAEIFTHRNGRTARWEADGSVYMLSYHEHTLPDFVPEDLSEYKFAKKVVLPDLPQWSALYIGKGKRDKISRGDIAGFFMKKGGLRSEEVGPIMVLERYSYAAVRRNRVRELLSAIEGQKIKGVKTIVSVAHN